MEKTTRPTQTGTNIPVNQRSFVTGTSYGTGQRQTQRVSREEGQSGQWADYLALEYQKKLAGQDNGNQTTEYVSGQSGEMQGRQGIPDGSSQGYGPGGRSYEQGGRARPYQGNDRAEQAGRGTERAGQAYAQGSPGGTGRRDGQRNPGGAGQSYGQGNSRGSGRTNSQGNVYGQGRGAGNRGRADQPYGPDNQRRSAGGYGGEGRNTGGQATYGQGQGSGSPYGRGSQGTGRASYGTAGQEQSGRSPYGREGQGAGGSWRGGEQASYGQENPGAGDRSPYSQRAGGRSVYGGGEGQRAGGSYGQDAEGGMPYGRTNQSQGSGAHGQRDWGPGDQTYSQRGRGPGDQAYSQRGRGSGDRDYSQGSQSLGGRTYSQEGQRSGGAGQAYDQGTSGDLSLLYGQIATEDMSRPYSRQAGDDRDRDYGPEAGRQAGWRAGTKGGRQAKESRAFVRSQEERPVQQKPGTGKKPGGGGANFLVQGSILAVAGIIVRLIGMVYRIPLARKIGDNGNGYYNAAYSIYSILLIMSSYSLPTAVSKMISARLAKGQYRNSTRIFRAAMFYATAAGMAGFCALWFGADYFAASVIKMPYSSYALKALAPTIWIMAYLGVLRGYFQGHSTMIPTAVSQIFEQVVNAVVSIVAASVLFDLGVKSNLVFGDTEFSYAFGAAGGAIGTGAGALTALVLFLMLAAAYRPTMKKQARRDRGGQPETYRAISGALFATIVPIIISSAIYNISNVVDNSLFGHVMEDLGESSMTASHWGVYMGRYHLLFNIPVAIANSLSSSLIPSLSRAVAGKNRRQIHTRIASAIRFSMIIAIPSAVGLTVLAGPVSNLLFSGMDNTMLIEMMALGSSAVVFFSLSTVTNAILQGINRMNVPIVNSAVSLGIHVAVLYVMLRYLHMGIYSVVYANILFAALVCVLNGISIARYARYRQEIVKTFLIPLVSSGIMGAAAWGIQTLTGEILGNAVSTAVSIFAAVAVYFVVLILLKGVDEQELRSMPGGTRLAGIAKKMRLM